jgi:hypothetical protein
VLFLGIAFALSLVFELDAKTRIRAGTATDYVLNCNENKRHWPSRDAARCELKLRDSLEMLSFLSR